jgi:hypothetical protein
MVMPAGTCTTNTSTAIVQCRAIWTLPHRSTVFSRIAPSSLFSHSP